MQRAMVSDPEAIGASGRTTVQTAERKAAAWVGSTMDWRAEGMLVLTAGQQAEIDAALAALRRAGDPDLPAITADTFRLPTLHAVLRERLHALRHGCGFLLLRGLGRERYSDDDLARIQYGLGAHLGAAIAQSWQGELLGNVIDVSDVEVDARGYHAGGAQRMHTDSADIVSLMCLRAAPHGGASRIASAVAVHDHLARERPDLLALLYDGLTFRRMERDATYGDGTHVRRIAIFARRDPAPDAEVSVYLSGTYPRRAAAAGDAVLTDAQTEALDEVERLASSPAFRLAMDIAPGDIQFINNRILLHGRDDYRDATAIGQRRHLLRLWLRVPGWPPLPASQMMHTDEDQPGWLRQRVPRMELPSVYLAAKAAEKAGNP
jgi:hypothetical protein